MNEDYEIESQRENREASTLADENETLRQELEAHQREHEAARIIIERIKGARAMYQDEFIAWAEAWDETELAS